MVTELWTPQGITDHSVSPAGYNAETGSQIHQHLFQVHDPVTNKRHKFCVITDEDTSQAHLEDMVSSAVDTWLTEIRAKEHKPSPTPEQRKEIGRILNDIKIHSMKRGESSTGRIHFRGSKI